MRGYFTDKIKLHIEVGEVIIQDTPVVCAFMFIRDKKGVIHDSVLTVPFYDQDEVEEVDRNLTRENIKYLLIYKLHKAYSSYRHMRAFTASEGKVHYNDSVYVFDLNKIIPKMLKEIHDKTTRELLELFLMEHNHKLKDRNRVHITRL